MSLEVVKNLKEQLKTVPAMSEDANYRDDIPSAEECREIIDQLSRMSSFEYLQVRKEKAKILGITLKMLDDQVVLRRKQHDAQSPEAFLNHVIPREKGLFYENTKEDFEIWLCDSFEFVGATRDAQGENQGLALRFTDTQGAEHVVSFQREELFGDAARVFRELLARGFSYNTDRKAVEYLKRYLVLAKPERTCLIVQKTGWVDPSTFILPGDILAHDQDREIFLRSNAKASEWRTQGTLDEWRHHVGALCSGNSRLLLAASAAFAAPLMYFVESESGGLHFQGISSTGKSTASRVANSVWGSPEREKSWRATSNGLEATAEQFNHTLLCLDEIEQIRPQELGEAAYMLANGCGKARANRDSTVKNSRQWNLFLLSTGEISLADHIAQANQKVRAGHEVRIVNVAADAGSGLGIFEKLHDRSSPHVLADELKAKTSRSYGTAARYFIKHLLNADPAELAKRYFSGLTTFIQETCPADAAGQVSRVATKFFLVGFAGELATEIGATGWEKGEAMAAAKQLFDSWVRERNGYGNAEIQQVMTQVGGFFQRYGNSRFINLDPDAVPADLLREPVNRAGYRESVGGDLYHYVFTTVFRDEVCQGINLQTAVKVLKDAGVLKPGKKGDSSILKRIPGESKPTRFYRLVNILGDEEPCEDEDYFH